MEARFYARLIPWVTRRNTFLFFLALVAFFILSALHSTRAVTLPTLSVSGGVQTGDTVQPFVFTWNGLVSVQGSAWAAGEAVSITLKGPLNSPGVSPSDIVLATVNGDDQGTFSASLPIPYDNGVTGPRAKIPRPGLYTVRGTGTVSGMTAAADPINLCPATYLGAGGGIDWSRERGTRDGVLPGPLRTYSPERTDPNWLSVWDGRPVEAYGTVAVTETDGANQPARVSFEDDPITHYAHDAIMFLLPDPQYRWTMGTANYYGNEEDKGGVALGRIKLEWETLNDGSPAKYGTGRIGLPTWATPTAGDRMYVLGRWVLDAGHPEVGDRTEIHPPRLVAVMRQRPTASTSMVAASQVDIYVSGHGGGANRFQAGLDALLNQDGYGGGRLLDVLSAADQKIYYQAGPFSVLPVISFLVMQLTGMSITGPIYPVAGPSAFRWGSAAAPEEQPINDMDYDFNVPLPSPPDGAVSVNVEFVTQLQHSTAVAEIVTYPDSGNGLPSTARVHLPYRGADNGIYARTLKFSWSTTTALPNHFRVRLDRVRVNATAGEWHLWSDISGQWTYLSGLAPALLKSVRGQVIATPGARFDVYLHDNDTLRILTQGYRAQCLDHLFGNLFGMKSYSAAVQILQNCGPVNNDNLGGALLELPALPSSQGSYVVAADLNGQTGGGPFQVELTVEYVNKVQISPDCQGGSGSPPVISTGGVVGAGLSNPRVNKISPNGLISVFGHNFARPGTLRPVTGGDLRNGQLPTNLACTCVTVNNQLASIFFVSPTQINVQAPSLLGAGNMAVRVIANCSAPDQIMSNPQNVLAQVAAPEFFFFKHNASGTSPIAATNAITGALIGAKGLLPGATFTPAKPGDFVALYATGFGVTNPAFRAGALSNKIGSTVSPVSVSINGVVLAGSDVLYAGVAPGFAGLYQINIHIPTSMPNGDLPVSASINGISTPTGAFITVQK